MSILESIEEHAQEAPKTTGNKEASISPKTKDSFGNSLADAELGKIDPRDTMEQVAIHNKPSNNQNSVDDRGAQAVENREGIQHEIGEISNLILRDGAKFTNNQTGRLVFKDDNNAILQIGKNIGLSYDAQNFKNIELGERVTVSMVQDEHRVFAAAEFERQQQAHNISGADRAVELDNEMH